MKRAFVLLLDSFGIGASDDADKYGDKGANTLGHIARDCYLGKANREGLRKGPLHLPNLARYGLYAAATESCGTVLDGFDAVTPEAKYGYACEVSHGKDTPSGHWEIAGVPVLFDWGYFPPDYPSFPQALTDAFISRGNLPGILGNRHASGTEIIQELGEEHRATGKPIVYTSGDSVFQIAAHEQSFGLKKLYALCELARELVDEYNIGRVIARPFLGEPGNFYRTANRRDYSTPPPSPTLFDRLKESGGTVIAVGKTADIFAHQGISEIIKADGNMALFNATLQAMDTCDDRCLIFTNFVDFDSVYGHRRDVIGYAAALEALDRRLPELERKLKAGDVVIITADHGCDPTWTGSDHTREHIPVLAVGPDIKPGSIGRRETFSDIGQSIAYHLDLPPLSHGKSFLGAN